MSSISFRDSIRWLPHEASEPTETLVLTGKDTNTFLDVRFLKESTELDWAFAGYREHEDLNTTRFIHIIDSRTKDANNVIDQGKNSPLPDGRTLEAGEMINPATGQMAKYEEVWRDEKSGKCLFVRNLQQTAWYARVGRWHLGLGRDDEDFWAWRAFCDEDSGVWEVKNLTKGGEKHVWILPEDPTEIHGPWEVLEYCTTSI